MPRVSELGRQVEKKLLSCWAREATTNKPQITQMAQIRTSLTALPSTFDHLDVLVERYVCEFIDRTAGPTNLDRIDLGGGADAEDLSRIVRRKIAAAARAQTRSLHAAGLPRDHRAHRRRITLRRDEIQPHPVVLVAT